MRVLITGVSGFVGSRAARSLLVRGHEVAGTYIQERPELEGVDLFQADLLEPAELEDAIGRWRPEAILHLAGLTHVGESWHRMHEYFAVNVVGSENLLRAAAGVRTVVASSAEVYGSVPEAEQPIAEERPAAPQSPYALTKAAVERLALLSGGIVVRSFNLVGPGQAASFALPSFARQLAEIRQGGRRPVLRVGNLDARRDILHVDDGVSGYETVLLEGEPGGIYNLGRGEAVRIGDALDLLVEVSGVRAQTKVDPQRWRPADLPLLIADPSRLRALGWKPVRDLRQALVDLWRSLCSETGG